MMLHRASYMLPWLYFLLSMYIFPAFQTDYRCFKKDMYPSHGYYRSCSILDDVGKIPVSLADCERLCRQFWACDGLNMEWENLGEKIGLCSILTCGQNIEFTANISCSFYGICPPGMVYFPMTASCYRYGNVRQPWDVARNSCKDFHVDAVLLEISTEEKHKLLESVLERDSGPETDCKTSQMGTEYRGHVNTTISGITCQRWDTLYPHWHNRNNASLYPLAPYNEVNYCRNPDYENAPWCYTTDPNVRWDLCDIPWCHNITRLWLGAVQKPGDGIGQYSWVSSNQNVETGFTNWNLLSASTNHVNSCLAVGGASSGYSWMGEDCDERLEYICEFRLW